MFSNYGKNLNDTKNKGVEEQSMPIMKRIESRERMAQKEKSKNAHWILGQFVDLPQDLGQHSELSDISSHLQTLGDGLGQ